MAFIPSSSTIQLYAYFTQYGREKIANSDKINVVVTKFSLHDDDVNYLLTKEIVNGNYNKLPSGFVPDLTGDIDTCIKSIAKGIDKEYLNKNMVTGTTSQIPVTPPPPPGTQPPPPPPPPPSGTRTLTVGFDRNRFFNPNSINGKSGSDTFFIYLKQQPGDLDNPTLSEIDATQINITIESYTSEFITQPIISPVTPVYFSSTADATGNKQFSFTFQKQVLTPPRSETLQIVFRVTSLSPNRIEESGFETYTYEQEINWS